MPSESSSLDEKCRCGHPRRRHLEPPGAQCVACPGDEERSWRHDFVPADAEAAGKSECTCSSGNPENYEGPARDCPVHGEPEEHEHDWSEWGAVYHGGHFQWRTCFSCRNTECRKEGHSCPECTPEPEAPERSVFECESDCVAHGGTEPHRRSPYAVAYELQDGSAFEVALPGDATVRADDGLLIIHHAQSPVKGLVQVKPWGNQ